ncbi:hypothetical protein B5S28_g3421 [[Candida] boidinii]|uniref:Unnamed protein product n=1 Tax=Candida boidinii TaxID=5477 RepID=A0ACB5TS95_CANBO|nr:hypothetical protein B5S28_g3421 [[Candida] boidinii]OWB64259.1 hypothetical protein B5S29_g5319 [[Candida] boidinii]OWB75635.1 hypothetical protein B5S31_g5567 [[Candida] boidinii]OWB79092.1 hypothetical protein B5S32_g3303 [[Candida] boidinii]GME93834.1 unnamed protein product [[Candida] boidinii]
MSDLFNTYESDFKISHSDARSNLDKLYGLKDENKRIELMQKIENSIDDCKDLLDSMILEVNNISTSSRSSYNAKLRTYKSDIDRLSNDLKKLMDDEDRRNLFTTTIENSDGSNADAMNSQRQTLLHGNASLDRSSQRLNDSLRIARETEDVGSSIMNNLHSQREQILNSRDTLSEADSYVDRSIQTIKSMTRRMATNKMITYGIIALLIILIMLVLYSKFS